VRLEGKRTLITGAGSGIGRAIAERVAAEGASVLAVGRTPEPLEETAALVRAAGAEAATAPLDVADTEAVAALFAGLDALDVLVNGAGIVDTHTVEGCTPERWDAVFATNVRGTFLCPDTRSRCCARARARSSTWRPWPGSSAYRTARPTAPPRAR
jgi:NAD(P)-dependent dehydrogenase (short-subunit alcohol dehydrogenase family)